MGSVGSRGSPWPKSMTSTPRAAAARFAWSIRTNGYVPWAAMSGETGTRRTLAGHGDRGHTSARDAAPARSRSGSGARARVRRRRASQGGRRRRGARRDPRAGADGRRRAGGRARPAPRAAGRAHVRRQGQARRAEGEVRGGAGRLAARRRRARAEPAAGARERPAGAGRRPYAADPRHLRAARAERRGKLQVELAQLEYNLPRMRGLWQHLERLGGGVGTRGPGESQLETDRRLARRRISILKRRLAELSRQRDVRRRERVRAQTPTIALAGYTNVGKSTLLNALTGADVAVEDRLFETLDPTTRSFEHDGRRYLVTDTVGFIRRLPHQLVEGFAATLEETLVADMVLHVVDASASDEEIERQ